MLRLVCLPPVHDRLYLDVTDFWNRSAHVRERNVCITPPATQADSGGSECPVPAGFLTLIELEREAAVGPTPLGFGSGFGGSVELGC